MSGRNPFPSLPRIALASALVVALPACERLHSMSGSPPQRRCEAPVALPGSTPMPDELRAAISAVAVPDDALRRRRKVCNRLALQPSTLARRHARDAVDWRPWSESTFEEARRLDRPVFVFTGFAACDQCVRLATRFFRRRPLALLLNSKFVPVLVDRHERPDADAYLMLGVQVLTGGGGWPAALFLDPEQARPFEAWSWGASGGGDRDLEDFVEKTARRVALGGSTPERAEATMEKMHDRAERDWSGPLPSAGQAAAALRRYLAEIFVREAGAFGEPPLFPRAPQLDFLLALAAGSGDAETAGMVAFVLDALAASPMIDGSSGAVRRFARARGWQDAADAPLLADNAALARVTLDAAEATGREDLARRAKRTLGFLAGDLALPGGAFAASTGTSGRDGAVMADANAAAISALVRAAAVLDEPRWLEAARTAAAVLDATLRDGPFVRHALWPDGRVSDEGYLADQALVALAFLDLDSAEASGNGRWLEAARAIADGLVADFEHRAGGGFFEARAGVADVPLRLKPAHDGAVPCGNSAAALLFVRLAARTGDAAYAAVARRTLEAYSEILTLRPLALPAMVVALMEWEKLPSSLREAAAARATP